ncbi:MAG: hypothetical protein IT379_20900 [Deltaproteobacteria bacterium]|nr:hypothetical protein [Deltaproteobacteria bacterium]
MARAVLAGVLAGAVSAAAGCEAPGVGDPCTPENVPMGGFKETEVYLETSSLQCRTRVCLVYRFQGVPSGLGMRTQDEEDGVYCTCRCAADQSGARLCECPDGYECREIFQTGGDGVRGSYCIKRGT